ncbi:hypothetical protein Csp2054_07365 [Curtobacterium sp. 'Ferrero']|uniref:DUF4233 domain-containing protein n=1 Tax=Curtobacterium sp. 'Ferrero' TaxID=2033654 RepID=UPI000BD1FCBD|nr:DUF4233 domain-containing protein [Curtobacterium sp. 'Ferrero']PCN48234.1 hypothetical protein Csp2054_07365 [Curtobacterium sp. 'Ferrero']
MTEPNRASRPEQPTNAARPPRQRRPRRDRGARESLLSITLGLEAVMFFFPMLVTFGKHTLPPLVAFGGGIGAIIVLALASRLTGNRAGVWFGWLLQAAILATGFIEPFMFAVGAVFLALWIYCFAKGGQLDRQNAARRAAAGEG